jgi:putative hemolysin
MTKCLFIGLLLAALGIGCGQPDNQVAPADPSAEPEPANPPAAAPTGDEPGGVVPVKIANPASTHCVERGGEVEIMSAPGGQFGVCVFDDGSRCEEWDFFRGECKPGECAEQSGQCD